MIDIRARLSEFFRLKSRGQLTPDITDDLATSVATAFMSHAHATGEYLRDAITLLCEIATLSDESVARAGLRGLFPLIVERLADSFAPSDCSLYYRVFAQVIQFCRSVPAGAALGAQLDRFALRTEDDLLERVERIRRVRAFDDSRADRVKKVVVLSRITLGADVEITSVVLQKMKRRFPQAEIVFLAEEKAGELFGGDRQVRLYPLRYRREGGLIERLSGWLSVVEALDDETRALSEREFLVVDPDSRLTQLGLLPVVPDESNYYFFESRSYRRPDAQTLAELTGQWLAEVFGGARAGDLLYPYVSLREETTRLAGALIEKLKRGGAPSVVSVSLGTGGNPAKRIPDPFEENLLLSLIADGAMIILDKGAGEEELRRIDQLIGKLRRTGRNIIELDPQNVREILAAGNLRAEVITWQGGIGQFSAFISHSDQYIGYDSAGQHIAAAMAIPTIVVFAGFTSPLVPERWRPGSRGLVKSVVVDTLQLKDQIDSETVLRDVLE
jgi:ADP-heptose:LPS heptosyltransferase